MSENHRFSDVSGDIEMEHWHEMFENVISYPQTYKIIPFTPSLETR